ncbi:MAG: oxidoreductase [Burkholderiales bacterium 66-5]|mgnify:CR=1 FL=1|nr:MAG: oxidoreductase [Burkholderiales bacterium 66-5]
MTWRALHRWLGLVAGTVALLLGLTGVLLATDPVRDAWRGAPAAPDLSIATLAQRAADAIAGIEEIRRLPSGDIVVYAFEGDTPKAVRINPQDGQVLGDWQPSALSRWMKNLHRSFLLGDAGRLAAASVALAMLLLCVSGLVLTARRMGGWRQLATRVRGSGLQRLHVQTGRIAVAVLLLSSISTLTMSAATFNLIPTDAGSEPDVVSAPNDQRALTPAELPLLRTLQVRELRKLSFPGADDPQDTWVVDTRQGTGWIDRYSGEPLAWQAVSPWRRMNDLVNLLHTGEGAWPWALVLALLGASIPVFWATGGLLWLQGRRDAPRIRNRTPLAQADTLIFVASEGGSTWGFAQTLQQALAGAGHLVHVAALEQFQTSAATRQVFILAATYGDGQAPAHAAQALTRIASQPVGSAPIAVLGFGDRQFSGFCAYAEALDRQLRECGWPVLLPLERIHQQSPQAFARWGAALAEKLQESIALDYVPRIPAAHRFTLVQREDFPGATGTPAAILRFALPQVPWAERLRGRGLPHFRAGDLVGILAPGSAVPRHYSLASGTHDGFLEICVRRVPGGACSGYLHALQPGDAMQGFIQPNPGFALDATRRPVLLIGAGTGVAPLAGFIRGNRRRTPMHLYFGSRDPARDFYFGSHLRRWLGDSRLTRLTTAFSRTPDGGGYVQDALRRDAEQVRDLVAQGAVVRVCGSRPMASSVAGTLDDILGQDGSVTELRQEGRYAEDIF